MRRIIIVLFSSLISITIAQCEDKPKQGIKIIATKKKASPKKEILSLKKCKPLSTNYKKTIIFGITPLREDIKDMYCPLANYLSQELKVNVNLIVTSSYKEIQEHLKADKIQVASVPPSILGGDLTQKHMNYLVTTKKGRNAYYESYIIVNKDSIVNSLKDMKSKVIGFTNKSSSSGYIFPYSLFTKKGIKPEKYFKTIVFLGDHDNVINAVHSKSVDIGATWDAGFHNFIERKKIPASDFKIIKELTQKIPLDPIVTSKSVSPKLRRDITNALLKINKNTKVNGSPVISDVEPFFEGFEVNDIKLYYVYKEKQNVN
ncbi:MAG: phosphate/phosphite/phosphonate ABC transporter substrate-binding protein [Spirochaetota bacterium]|nr:phosphate/phosphite/phosphonate ABC transporter substrate-binding protein [Spirochaetota bacterium]